MHVSVPASFLTPLSFLATHFLLPTRLLLPISDSQNIPGDRLLLAMVSVPSLPDYPGNRTLLLLAWQFFSQKDSVLYSRHLWRLLITSAVDARGSPTW